MAYEAYTTFGYASLAASYTNGSPGQGDHPYAQVATVTAVITNTGQVSGAEVAQLYIRLPSTAPQSPPRQLRGFQKVPLAPGASQTVSFPLRRKDLSYWNTQSQSWQVPTGSFTIEVGASSRDIRLTGTL
jgi:beta-glucosidase